MRWRRDRGVGVERELGCGAADVTDAAGRRDEIRLLRYALSRAVTRARLEVNGLDDGVDVTDEQSEDEGAEEREEGGVDLLEHRVRRLVRHCGREECAGW